MKYDGKTVVSSLSLKFLEQLLTKVTGIVVGIVLARLLNVEDFGVVAILSVFTSFAYAIIEGGLSTSLIRMKDADDTDYSTVFYTTGGLTVILYAILFFAAPAISGFYDNPNLALYLRVMGIGLFATPFNAIQFGYAYRYMMFKRLLVSSVASSVISGGIGIAMAYCGFGVWALITQSLTSYAIAIIVLFITIPWRPKALFSFERLKMHFSYGWKLLVSSIAETLYIDAQALIIGKKYSEDRLAYYNRGEIYPKALITSLSASVQAVMFPVLSSSQDNRDELKKLMRKAVSVSAFLLFPVMAGFAAVSESFVTIVLTEKWLPCVRFLQLACLTYAIMPINSCNAQAIKAIGRSDVFMALTLIKKSIGLAIIALSAFCFGTPLAIALAVALYAPVELIINALPNRKFIGYTLREQLGDIALPFVISAVMFASVYSLTLLDLGVFVELSLQVVLGVGIYVGMSLLFRVKAMKDVIETAKKLLKKNKSEG